MDFVQYLFQEADRKHASDIHIDPTENNLRIRERIDGKLHDIHTLLKDRHQELISRIKVLAKLRLDEHNAPQDGRCRIMLANAPPLDIRVSIMPTYHGEACVLRLLRDRIEAKNLSDLGMRSEDSIIIERAMRKTTGMIIVTGPTGSGKTTTLYTLLKMLNTPDKSLITIEDPIEYAIPNVRQIQVHPQRNLTFASGLRSVLRQDPDIIMVGEIRDTETAKIAVQSALTGHLILTTLHTNDAPAALPRLVDMGIEPYIIASTVDCIISQRLVRKKDTGGRIGLYEVLKMNETLRLAIIRKESGATIRSLAINNNMKSLYEDGMEKVAKNLTTLEEVLAATEQ